MASLFPAIADLEPLETVYGFTVYDPVEIRDIGLVDLADYTEGLARHCGVMADMYVDGSFACDDEKFREQLDDINGHLVLVAGLLARRTAREYPNA